MRTVPVTIRRVSADEGTKPEDEIVARFVCDDGPGGKIPGLKPTQRRSSFLRWTEVHLPLLKEGLPPKGESHKLTAFQ
jgi:hypothetical protein